MSEIAPLHTSSTRKSGRKRLMRNVSLVRNFASSIKDLGLIAIVLVLIVRPNLIISFVTERKIDSESLSFYDIKMPFNEGLRELQEQGEIRQQSRMLSEGSYPPELASLLDQVARTEPQVVTKIESDIFNSDKAGRFDDWASVLSCHRTREDANAHKATLLKRFTTARLRIVQRSGVYRVVWILGNRDSWAEVRFQLRSFPERFPVRFNEWCPSAEMSDLLTESEHCADTEN